MRNKRSGQVGVQALGKKELDQELQPDLPGSPHRIAEPAVELIPALWGQLIHLARRANSLLLDSRRNPTRLIELFQMVIEHARLQPHNRAERFLGCEMPRQIIPMRARIAFSQETKNCMFSRHVALLLTTIASHRNPTAPARNRATASRYNQTATAPWCKEEATRRGERMASPE